MCRHRWLTRSWDGRERRGVKGIEPEWVSEYFNGGLSDDR